MSDILSLNCLVWDDVLDHLFVVDLPSTENVSTLKEVIKKQKRPYFDSIPANHLDIYHTSSLVAGWDDDDDDYDGEGLMQALANESHAQILPHHVLSEVFRWPLSTGGIHILVKPPPTFAAPPFIISLNCLVLGDTRNHIFPVKLAISDNVGVLKEAIKDENQNTFRDVDADQLSLYRTSLPDDGELEGKLRSLNYDEPLQPTSILARVFPVLPDESHLHIVVQPPHEEQNDILTELNESFKRTITLTKNSRSEATESKYMSIQEGERRILDCRCVDTGCATVGPPIQLFNPAFAYFTSKAFDPEHDVPPAFICRVRDAVVSFAFTHSSESYRRGHLTSIIQDIVGCPRSLVGNVDGTSSDGVGVHTDERIVRYPVIHEEQRELVGGQLDPSTQGTFSYLRMFRQSNNRTLLLKTCCPAFIICHAGPWLTILGGVITSKCIIQRLTDFLWVPIHSTGDDDHWLRIARVFYVLQESIGRLRSWYESNKAGLYNPARPISHPRFFPSIDMFSEGGVEVRFRYRQPLESDDTCVTFLAQTIETCPRKIVVKFVTRYGIDAHRTMADAGFAPKLRYFGPISTAENAVSYGKLKMVVMDYIEGLTLQNALEQEKVPASFATHLRQAIEQLHDAGLVFGDLRMPNLIVTPNDEVTVRLIDFDWAGKDGEVKYPMIINLGILWAEGVGRLKPIKKQHDLFRLDYILEYCP